MRKLRRGSLSKKPVPAALAIIRDIAVTRDGTIHWVEQPLVEQLAPTDPLRLRLVASDPEVRHALKMFRSAHAKWVKALRRAHLSAQADADHRSALRDLEIVMRDVLVPAILRAEAQRRRGLAATPPDMTELAGKVVRRVNANRVLAVDVFLRRHPHWKDPSLWTAPDAVRYLAKAVASEARFISSKQKQADRPKIARGEHRFRGRSETAALRQERARLKRLRRGLELLRQLYRTLPSAQRRIVLEMKRAKCGPYVAASRLGIARSAAVALRARAQRLLAKDLQSRRSSTLH
ncbi:MAG: hypothetical protein HYR74_12545 [Candidatus Eisenbacteria bacterium]|nr:hypothetical protein [Candidatus Eisenbacteria bacterium]